MDQWEYRIVLKMAEGELVPLLPQGSDLAGAQERLDDILDRNTFYVDGWIERRPNNPNDWVAIKVCPDCNGEGGSMIWTAGSKMPDPQTEVTCDTCEGDGVVPVEK